MEDPSGLRFLAHSNKGIDCEGRFPAREPQEGGETSAFGVQRSRLQDNIHFITTGSPFIQNRRGKSPIQPGVQVIGSYAAAGCFLQINVELFRRENVFEVKKDPAAVRKPSNLLAQLPS
jgi:hypothetical protein